MFHRAYIGASIGIDLVASANFSSTALLKEDWGKKTFNSENKPLKVNLESHILSHECETSALVVRHQ